MDKTHILKHWGRDRDKKALLFRATDGVLIGMQEKETVVFGEVPNERKSRTFIDIEHAQRFLCETVTRKDLDERGIAGPVELERQNQEGNVILAGDPLDMPGFAGSSVTRRN